MIPVRVSFSSLGNSEISGDIELDEAIYILAVPHTDYALVFTKTDGFAVDLGSKTAWRLCSNCAAERCGETVRVVKGRREGYVEFYDFSDGSLNFIEEQQVEMTPHKGLTVDSINPVAVFCDKYETVALVRVDYVTEEDSDEIALSEHAAVSINGETVEVDVNVDETFINDAQPLGLIGDIPTAVVTACDDFTCNVESTAVAFYDGDSIKINYITNEYMLYANAARQGFIAQLASGPYPYVTLVPDYEENAVVGKYLSENDIRKMLLVDLTNIENMVLISGFKQPSFVIASLGTEIIGGTVFHDFEWSEIYSCPLLVDGLESLNIFTYADFDETKNRVLMVADGKIWIGEMRSAKLIKKYV